MIRIGMVATHQLSFPGDKEGMFAKAIEGMKKNAAEMGFEFVWHKNLVITEEEARAARADMEAQKIDFLLMLNISYSSGFLAPILYRTKGARVGIWSIPEGGTKGPVMFNSFCSNNMWQGINDKYLRAEKIASKWFYGYADDERFQRRLSVTVQALSALKKLGESKVALIGGFAPGFNDLYFDERAVLAKFPGMTINRLHEYGEIIKLADSVTDADIKKYADEEKNIKRTENAGKLYPLSLKIYLGYKRFIEEHGYDAIAVSCWPKFQDDYKYSVCSVVGMLNDDEIVTACEGDLMSAISMLALQEMTKNSTMLMDFSAFDESDETVLMWHCGPASKKFCKRNGYTLGENYSGMPHEKWKVNGIGVARDMEFDEGDATVFRFSGDMERYLNLSGHFVGNSKESFCGSRGWMGNLKLNHEKIGALDFTNTILASGFEHHYPIGEGDCSAAVTEMNNWLGIKPVERVPYADYLQIKEK